MSVSIRWELPLILAPRLARGPALLILSYLSHAIINGEGSLGPRSPPSQKFVPVGYFFLSLYLKPLVSIEFLVVHI